MAQRRHAASPAHVIPHPLSGPGPISDRSCEEGYEPGGSWPWNSPPSLGRSVLQSVLGVSGRAGYANQAHNGSLTDTRPKPRQRSGADVVTGSDFFLLRVPVSSGSGHPAGGPAWPCRTVSPAPGAGRAHGHHNYRQSRLRDTVRTVAPSGGLGQTGTSDPCGRHRRTERSDSTPVLARSVRGCSASKPRPTTVPADLSRCR